MNMGVMLGHRRQGQEETTMEALVVFVAAEVVEVVDALGSDDLRGQLSMVVVLFVICRMGGASGEDIRSEGIE